MDHRLTSDPPADAFTFAADENSASAMREGSSISWRINSTEMAAAGRISSSDFLANNTLGFPAPGQLSFPIDANRQLSTESTGSVQEPRAKMTKDAGWNPSDGNATAVFDNFVAPPSRNSSSPNELFSSLAGFPARVGPSQPIRVESDDLKLEPSDAANGMPDEGDVKVPSDPTGPVDPVSGSVPIPEPDEVAALTARVPSMTFENEPASIPAPIQTRPPSSSVPLANPIKASTPNAYSRRLLAHLPVPIPSDTNTPVLDPAQQFVQQQAFSVGMDHVPDFSGAFQFINPNQFPYNPAMATQPFLTPPGVSRSRNLSDPSRGSLLSQNATPALIVDQRAHMLNGVPPSFAIQPSFPVGVPHSHITDAFAQAALPVMSSYPPPQYTATSPQQTGKVRTWTQRSTDQLTSQSTPTLQSHSLAPLNTGATLGIGRLPSPQRMPSPQRNSSISPRAMSGVSVSRTSSAASEVTQLHHLGRPSREIPALLRGLKKHTFKGMKHSRIGCLLPDYAFGTIDNPLPQDVEIPQPRIRDDARPKRFGSDDSDISIASEDGKSIPRMTQRVSMWHSRYFLIDAEPAFREQTSDNKQRQNSLFLSFTLPELGYQNFVLEFRVVAAIKKSLPGGAKARTPSAAAAKPSPTAKASKDKDASGETEDSYPGAVCYRFMWRDVTDASSQRRPDPRLLAMGQADATRLTDGPLILIIDLESASPNDHRADTSPRSFDRDDDASTVARSTVSSHRSNSPSSVMSHDVSPHGPTRHSSGNPSTHSPTGLTPIPCVVKPRSDTAFIRLVDRHTYKLRVSSSRPNVAIAVKVTYCDAESECESSAQICRPVSASEFAGRVAAPEPADTAPPTYLAAPPVGSSNILPPSMGQYQADPNLVFVSPPPPPSHPPSAEAYPDFYFNLQNQLGVGGLGIGMLPPNPAALDHFLRQQQQFQASQGQSFPQ